MAKKADDGTNIWGDPEHQRMLKVQKWISAPLNTLPKLPSLPSSSQQVQPPALSGMKSPIVDQSGDIFNAQAQTTFVPESSPASTTQPIVNPNSSTPGTSTTPPHWMIPTGTSQTKPSWSNTPAAGPSLLQQHQQLLLQQQLQQQILGGENNQTVNDDLRWHTGESLSETQANQLQQKHWIGGNNFREVIWIFMIVNFTVNRKQVYPRLSES